MAFHPNPGQIRALEGPLATEARNVLLYGGSRSGKTALFTWRILERAWATPGSRHLIVRQEASAAKRAIAKDTFPTVWGLAYPEIPVPGFNELYGYFTLPNGSEVWVGGLSDEKAMERILGNEYATIYENEASQIKYAAHLLLRTRLAQTVETANNGGPLPQRLYCDLNPTTRMHWTYRLWREGMDPQDDTPVDRTRYAWGQVNPLDNIANLSGDYIAELESLPARERKRYLDGEYAADDENALWKRKWIKRSRLKEDGNWPVQMQRIVVAIDPAVSTSPGSDETGIIAVGLGADGLGYVLADESGRHRPDEWARRAVSLYESLDADRIVGEINQGGDLIEATLRSLSSGVPYKGVRATRGKFVRAEPVAGLYERGKILHVGEFPDLEDQMASFTVGFDRKVAGYSPDRVDALVWAVMDLFPTLTARKSTTPIRRPKFSMV